MATSRILGPNGEPIQYAVLQEAIARPALTGIRTVWGHPPIAPGLTPVRLAQVLLDATDGWPLNYLTLAEEMEERDWHYSSVLGTRKRAVSGLQVTVEAASDSAADVRLADEIRELTQGDGFGDMVDDALDALGKGYSAIEIIWDRSDKTWMPTYVWRDPRFFRFDYVTQSQLLLLDDDNIMGAPLPPYKFIVHTPRLKSGVPVRGGLARLAAAAYMCKSYTLTDWMAFAEVFGMPLRIGRYEAGATQADINTLITAVANIGTDAAAIIPKSMQIDFAELPKTSDGGASVFQSLADWLDRQVSKAVLGQTMTTDAQSAGLGSNNASVHNDVRADIQISDAKQISNTLNRDLVKPYVDLNHGPQARYPKLKMDVVEPEDIQGMATALSMLVPLGLEVEQSVIRDKLGLPEPAPNGKLLHATAAAPKPPTVTAPTLPAPTFQPPAEQALADKAANRAQPTLPITDAIDDITDDALSDWQPLVRPIVDPVRALAAQAGDEDEFIVGLAALMRRGDAAALMRSLATQAFKARAMGDVSDDPET